MPFEFSENDSLSATAESSGHAITTILPGGIIASWNSSAQRIYGFSSKEAIGQNISIIIPDELLDYEFDMVENVKKNHTTARYETSRKTKNGDRILVELTMSPIENKEGHVLALSKVAGEISPQPGYEEKQAMLAAIVNSSDDAIISKTLDGIITSWNYSAQKMFGFTEKEAVGKHISLIIPKNRLHEESMIIDSIRNGRKIDHFETVRQSKDGKAIDISLTISPIKNSAGKIIGASKVARDITTKKLADEKQAMLAAIVNSSDDAIISKTLDGIITSWNESAQRMFGFSAEEAIGKHISIIIPKDRIQEETMIIDNIRNGKKIDHFETVRISKDGKLINISLTVSPIKNAVGKIIGASKVAKDISDKIALEKQRNLYTEKLQNLSKYKDEFMVMASHELRTPITVISANLQLLEHMMKDNEHYSFVDKSIKQVNKLSNLVTSLLDVSKVQAGKLELNVSVFDIRVLLREVKNDIELTSKNHRIVFDERSEKLLVNADRERMVQVIVNLLNNAIKYSPNSKEVVIEAKEDNGKILVSIADSGIGIQSEDLQNIFTRFYRVSGLPALFSGTGVGLYICAEIIKRHNGRIWAESKPGEGSVLYFYLPAEKSMFEAPLLHTNTAKV
ncbi:MAG TPA: PAS domain S-box protein [Hanamia sp.]|nr:PAS domain S-box protein [Hanamia sp.]